MPRAAYQITEADFDFARSYLSGQLRNYGLDLGDGQSDEKAESEYWNAVEQKGRKKRAEALQAWVDEYLSAEAIKSLRAAIRKRRQRSANTETTVTLSVAAFKLLRRVAHRDNVTYSEAVEIYFSKALASSRRAGKSQAKKRPR